MKGDPAIIRTLNAVLTNELTAVNQYFLHARMFESWGLTHLGNVIYEESIGEMKHADVLSDRILFLDALPNYQRLLPLRIGQSIREQFESDMSIEVEVVERLRPGIAMCRSKGDITSANLLEQILADEEEHIDYLETQLELINKLGEQLYLSKTIATPPTNG